MSLHKRVSKAWVFKYKGKPYYMKLRVDGKDMPVHRYEMEKHLGRKLKRSEHIHHINHNGLDNRIENLQIISAGEHARLHRPINKIKCFLCGKEVARKLSKIKRNNGKGFCSKICAYSYHGRNTPIIPCFKCGKMVIFWKSRIKRKKTEEVFCSHECHNLYRR